MCPTQLTNKNETLNNFQIFEFKYVSSSFVYGSNLVNANLVFFLQMNHIISLRPVEPFHRHLKPVCNYPKLNMGI